MKTFITLALAALAVANPVAIDQRAPDEIAAAEVEKRATGTTSNEFSLRGCRDVVFVWARGSTELGNMGQTVGPALSDLLKNRYGEAGVATEGVDYAALLSTNFNVGGADFLGIAEMKSILRDVHNDCPNSAIVVGGYSQGAALTHRAVEDLDDDIKNQIAAAVTFGDTQNTQDGGRIPDFPKEKTLIICNTGDAVCRGTLTILPAHLDYVRRAGEAASFIAQRIG